MIFKSGANATKNTIDYAVNSRVPALPHWLINHSMTDFYDKNRNKPNFFRYGFRLYYRCILFWVIYKNNYFFIFASISFWNNKAVQATNLRTFSAHNTLVSVKSKLMLWWKRFGVMTPYAFQRTTLKKRSEQTTSVLTANFGDSEGNWTPVTAVKGRCLNLLTTEPNGSPCWTRTNDIMINSHALYRLS